MVRARQGPEVPELTEMPTRLRSRGWQADRASEVPPLLFLRRQWQDGLQSGPLWSVFGWSAYPRFDSFIKQGIQIQVHSLARRRESARNVTATSAMPAVEESTRRGGARG